MNDQTSAHDSGSQAGKNKPAAVSFDVAAVLARADAAGIDPARVALALGLSREVADTLRPSGDRRG